MEKTPVDLDSVLDRYHNGFLLGHKGSNPQMEEDYVILMENLDSLNKQKRQAIVQDQIKRLISLRWAKIPYSKPKFGEALELELGVPTQQFSEGDLLGLELKTAKAGINTAIRLGSKIDGSVAHNVCRILQQQAKQSTKARYNDDPSIVYAGKYRLNEKLPIFTTDEERRDQGFLLTNGEVLTVGQPNRLGRVKFRVDQNGILQFGVKPPGCPKWMWGEGISLDETLKKFKHGFLFGTYLQYKENWVLVDLFKVKLNTGKLIDWIRQGQIGLEIRYNITKKGMENKGDSFAFPDGTFRDLIINQTIAERLKPGYTLPLLS